jgi:hypothetical protein
MGALKQGACDQGCLQPAALALKGLMFSYLEQVVIGVAAPWATKALRPTGRFQGVPALLIGAKLRKECRQRQAWLELDTVHGHGSFSLVGLFGPVCAL